MIKAIIFDMDGVLIDSEQVHMDFTFNFFHEHNLNYPKSVYLEKIGSSDSIFDDLNIFNPNADIEKLKNKMRIYQKELNINYPVIFRKEWKTEIEYFFNKNIPMAIASSSPMSSIKDMVESCKIDLYFETLVSGRDLPRSKPEPDIFLKTANNLRVEPENCLIIEDSKNGVLAGKLAGMTVIGYEDHRFDQDLSEADEIIAAPSQLRRFL